MTPDLINRRDALRLGSAMAGAFCVAVAAAAANFWNVKLPSQWTPQEIAQLTSNSPWAKQVTAQYRASIEGLRPGANSEPVQGRGDQKVGPCGLVPCGDVMPGTVTVIWESAQPIREALHPIIPPDFNGRYVISIRGLQGEYSPDRLTAGADLSAKGKPPIQPGLVQQRNNSWLFGFSKELLPLDTTDKDVLFNVRTGANLNASLVRATFSPKDMVYRGALAL